MAETIHVAYCLDDGYAECTCVSMASMLANTKSNVHFHIIFSRLSDENKVKLSLLSEKFPYMLLNFHEFTFDSNGFETGNSYLTAETYYRLYLPEILPDLERILYIDGDIVINGNISKLWNIDLENHTVGVVVDSYSQNLRERNKAIDFNDDDLYFNAGVMLINLKKFKKYLFPQQVSTIIPELYKRLEKINGGWNADQELLNYRFNADKSALFLPLQYNFMDKIFHNYKTQLLFHRGCYELKDWAATYSNPVIIHYSSDIKPFPLNGKVKHQYHWRLYYKYKALTPFYDPLDEKRIAEYNRREQLIKTEAFIPISFYMQLFWQDIFLNSAKHVKRILGNRKLVYWGAEQYITHIMAIFASNGLYPDAVVDDLASNHGKTVFEYTVQSAEILRGKTDEYFVVLCMKTKQAHDVAIQLLKEYGYNENGFTYAYAEAYERGNKHLLFNNILGFLPYAQSSKFIIYGAGQVGITLLRYLATEDLIDNVLCFAVSYATRESEEIMGVPMYGVMALPTNSRVLVAVHPKLHDEIINTLTEHGITDITGISWDCYLQMRRLIPDFSTEHFLRQKYLQSILETISKKLDFI